MMRCIENACLCDRLFISATVEGDRLDDRIGPPIQLVESRGDIIPRPSQLIRVDACVTTGHL
ncbi:hypothetical protein, partial [Microcoleus sp. D2_18a_D3]|uniref:hypothetical protein n=1 Tax=Microcoleus sp. D2_18a_D3 TaxID=3055330 RepID=UPI002FD70C13